MPNVDQAALYRPAKSPKKLGGFPPIQPAIALFLPLQGGSKSSESN
ncbi:MULTISPECIES: hypothetical protein [unclassified Leptolyngbya]|nr:MULTISPECIES: hypothetical protein [unclassified Leptolyngbya]MBD1911317.1 hypothetical protein [Leptolyngbya sp. FACHB-8]MBD2156665.1 hypothetical protein [Leptolyngbya sp. FACHB-16]